VPLERRKGLPIYTVVIKRRHEQFALVDIQAPSYEIAEVNAQALTEKEDHFKWENSWGGSEPAWVDSIHESNSDEGRQED
jgi:hypothetical protein